MTASNLEDLLVKDIVSGIDVSIERALLIVSGLTSEEQIKEYTKKIDSLQEGFKAYYDARLNSKRHETSKVLPEKSQIAKALFEYLWETKPDRFNENFLLTNAIDAQLSQDQDQKIGNCVGFTSLYTVLGLRNDLNLSVLYSTDHVLSVLEMDGIETYIDTTTKHGFTPEIEYKNFTKGNLIQLIAAVFSNRGNAKLDLRDLEGAIGDYNRAIELKPDFAGFFNNRGTAKQDLGDLKGAIGDYSRAIELKPDFAEAFYTRGNVKRDLGDLKGAIGDYNRFIELEPDYAEAFNNRGIAKKDLGDLEGAKRDFAQYNLLTAPK